MNWFDSHCHLDFDAFDDDREAVIKSALDKGVSHIFVPGVSRDNWQKIENLVQVHPMLCAGVGIHPYFLDTYQQQDLDLLYNYAQKGWVKAIGECGIDGFLAATTRFSVEQQQSIFEAQIDIANQTNKPLIVHHRKSHHLILQSFKRCNPKNGGIIHAFSGSLTDAKHYIALGFKLGCGGTITYERAAKTRNVFNQLDLQHIVLETDSPDMPLAGFQGQVNKPERVELVGRCLADVKGLDVAVVAEQTSTNAKTLLSVS